MGKLIPHEFPQRKGKAAAKRSAFVERAKQFLDREIPSFPVDDRKVPLTETGFKAASCDPRQIQKWGRQFPRANLAIPTGQKTGIIVVDLDCKGGVDGVAGFESMCDRHDITIPQTYKVKTPSGGQHLYFRTKHAATIRNSAGRLGAGIDVRGEGGYVLAVGSQIGGKTYTCIDGSIDEIARLPKKLRDAMQTSKTKKQPGNDRGGSIPAGTRNDALFKKTLEFFREGHDTVQTLKLIQTINQSICSPPLENAEVRKIVESASQYEPPDPETGEKMLTDMGGARRLAIANAGTLVYVSELGRYLHRTRTTHWRRNDGIEYVLAKKSARDLFKTVPQIENLKTQEAVAKFAVRSQSRPLIENCLKLAQTEPELAVGIHKFDSDAWSLPVKNGVVNLRTGEFRPIEAEDYFLNVSPVTFDADADCPNWISFLELVQPKRAMRNYLQKLVGLTLVGSASQEIIVFLYGVAGTGKSTFINAILKVLGRELAIKFSTSVLLARDRDGSANELLPFRGARLAVASEIPEGRRFNEAALKDLGSNDLLTTRPLFKESFQFQPTHQLWLYGNHLPRISGGDSGVWRRLSLLPFDQAIPKSKIDKDFGEILKHELAGILNWALKGCLAWQKSGVEPPLHVQKATKGYRSEMDVVSQFIDEQIEECIDNEVRANFVYTTYVAWAHKQGERPISNTAFGLALTERGFQKKRKRNAKYYLDIKVRENRR